MSTSQHPLARSTTAVRLREHNLLDIEETLGADAISVADDEVVFTRQARGAQPRRQWRGRLGDWLVADGRDFWRIVSDHDLRTAEAALIGEPQAG